MPASMTKSHTIRGHFEKRDPKVRTIYEAIVMAARTFGPMLESPKKTSIHLDRKSAFAGIATRKTALILTIKSDEDIDSPRVVKHQQTSPGRWHVDVRLESPDQVDRELVGWLRKAYALAG
jgi:hypothetical protein